jgi:cytochrome c biogenesis protein CcdA
MEFLQAILDNTNAPVLYAFLLGLMTAISPCPLAMNITAIAYIGKDIEQKRRIFTNGLIYTLGRAISYTTIGVILYSGASKFKIAGFFSQNSEKFIGPVLIIIGLLMLDFFRIKFPSFGKITDWIQGNTKRGSWYSSLFMGIIFALAFCPYSAVLYFGMLIPISISSATGLYLPLVFAIATGLPVIIVAYLLAFSVSSIGNFYNSLQIFQKWLNRIVAIVFIIIGFYYVYLHYLKLQSL